MLLSRSYKKLAKKWDSLIGATNVDLNTTNEVIIVKKKGEIKYFKTN